MDATEFQDWLGRIGLLSRQQLRQTFQALALYECASADVVEVSEVSAANAQVHVSVEKLADKSVGIEASALQPSSRDGTQALRGKWWVIGAWRDTESCYGSAH